jgi:hypothetical protein
MADFITEIGWVRTASSLLLLTLLLAGFPAWMDRTLRFIIITPFMHKVHHSRWQPETDSNYSSLFSFWDRLFRTFRLRDDPRTLEFGLQEFDGQENHTLTGLLATPLRRVQRTSAGAPAHASSNYETGNHPITNRT